MKASGRKNIIIGTLKNNKMRKLIVAKREKSTSKLNKGELGRFFLYISFPDSHMEFLV